MQRYEGASTLFGPRQLSSLPPRGDISIDNGVDKFFRHIGRIHREVHQPRPLPRRELNRDTRFRRGTRRANIQGNLTAGKRLLVLSFSRILLIQRTDASNCR